MHGKRQRQDWNKFTFSPCTPVVALLQVDQQFVELPLPPHPARSKDHGIPTSPDQLDFESF